MMSSKFIKMMISNKSYQIFKLLIKQPQKEEDLIDSVNENNIKKELKKTSVIIKTGKKKQKIN